jgi:hypothetical protein
MKYRPKWWKECEKGKKVRCECEMQMQCEKKCDAVRGALTKSTNTNARQKKFRTTIPVVHTDFTGAFQSISKIFANKPCHRARYLKLFQEENDNKIAILI